MALRSHSARSRQPSAIRPKPAFSLRKAPRLFARNGLAARPRQTDAGHGRAGSIRLPVPFQQPGLAQAFDDARLLRNEGRVVGLRDACPGLRVGIDFAQFGDRLLRLEGICEPGGVCLSEDAYRQVKSRLELKVADLEHFPVGLNRRGFPNRFGSDSCFWPAKGAGAHGQILIR